MLVDEKKIGGQNGSTSISPNIEGVSPTGVKSSGSKIDGGVPLAVEYWTQED